MTKIAANIARALGLVQDEVKLTVVMAGLLIVKVLVSTEIFLVEGSVADSRSSEGCMGMSDVLGGS